MKCFIFTLFIVLLNLTNSNAQTDTNSNKGIYTMSLSELSKVKVITSSKTDELIDDAPNVIYVITKEDILLKGYKNLEDALVTIPGLGVFHKDIQMVAQVRGIAPNDNEKITFMINGQSINQVYEPEVFNGAIRLENLERIEIIVGPGSVLYGSETLGAIVNMITKKTNDTEIYTSTGNNRTHSATLNYGAKSKKGNVFLSASYAEKGGYDAWSSNSNSPGNSSLSGTEYTGLLYPSFTILGQATHKNLDFQFYSLNSQTTDLHLHKGAAKDGRRYDYLNLFRVKNKKEWDNKTSSRIELLGGSKRTLRNIVELGNGTGDQPQWDISQTFYATEAAVQRTTKKNYFQAGIQTQLKQHRHNYDYKIYPDNPDQGSIGKDSTYNNYIRSIVKITNTHSYAIYLSDEFKLSNKLKFTAAIRFDYDDILENKNIYTSPRVATIYKPKENIIFKLMYNKSTRMPPPIGTPLNMLWGKENEGEPYAPSWATLNYNADKPEQLTAYEFQSITYIKKTRIAFNLYYQVLNDYITWFAPRTNVGDFTGYGFEAEVKSEISKKLNIWANTAYTQNEFVASALFFSGTSPVGDAAYKTPSNDKGEAAAVPKITGLFGANYNVYKTINFSSYVRYFTLQPMNINNEWIYANNVYYLNATVVWTNILKKKWDISFSVKNILNNRKFIGSQWQKEAYKPRGENFEITSILRF